MLEAKICIAFDADGLALPLNGKVNWQNAVF